MRESLIALKSILKEIDPYVFDQALTPGKPKGKDNRVKQDPEERKKLDDKWAKLTAEVKKKHPDYTEPDGMIVNILVPFTVGHLVSTYNELYAKIYDKEKYVTL